MDTTHQATAHQITVATSSRVATVIRNTIVGLATLTTIGAPAPADANRAAGSTESAAHQTVNPTPSTPVTHFSTDRGPTPDATAEYIGGIAARLHTTGNSPIPGNIFILMATPGSDNPARLYDHTPYTHDNGTSADAHASNIDAAATAEAITSTDVNLLDFTTAPGGGSSAGITYTIAYLNVISNGAFTGNIRIAATGRLATDGYVRPINAINEKAAAAHLADADVLFTPSTPNAEHLDSYHAWGATRPDGLDIVGIRHIADVAAYLCGNGSTYACQVTDHYNDKIIGAPAPSDSPDETSHTPTPNGLH